MKRCSKCKQEKQLTEFCKRKKKYSNDDGFNGWCKECAGKSNKVWRKSNLEKHLDYQAKYRQENREEIRRRQAIYYKNNPEKARLKSRKAEIKKKYGITYEQYMQMRQEQENKCFICKNIFKDKWDCGVDHDHKTGKIRALLCGACNKLLGYARDNVQILQSAISYLQKHSPADSVVVLAD